MQYTIMNDERTQPQINIDVAEDEPSQLCEQSDEQLRTHTLKYLQYLANERRRQESMEFEWEEWQEGSMGIICDDFHDYLETLGPSQNANELNSRLRKVRDEEKRELLRKTANKKNILPEAFMKWRKTQAQKEGFLPSVIRSVRDLPPKSRRVLLGLCGSVLCYGANLFDSLSGISTNTKQTQSPLSTRDAFAEFFPEIVFIAIFILCFLLSFTLVWSLPLGMQLFVMLLVISTPFFYFHQLWLEASGVEVACHYFKMPLIGFKVFWALLLAIICGFFMVYFVYFYFQHIQEGDQEEKDSES